MMAKKPKGLPDPATTPAHEGGERAAAREMAKLMVTHGYDDWEEKVARDYLRMDAEITRLREALELAHDYITLPFVNFSEKRPNVPRTEPGDSWAYVAKTLSVALAGTSADAGARETVTVWGMGGPDELLSLAKEFFERYLPTTQTKAEQLPYVIAITVTPGKERGT
jgi:hypothetical protein